MTGNMSFQDALYLLSIHTDRDGDVGTVFTFSQTNWPLIQFIPAWRITNKANETTVESGTYKGMRIRDGVIINKNGRAVAYRVETTNGYSDISAQTLSMLYDYNDFTQIRGLPLMTHGIEAMRMAGLSKEYEMFAMLIAGSYALIVNNPEGAPDDDPSSLYGTTNTTTGQGDSLSQTLIDSGMVRYFESNTGSKVEQLKMDRPGTSWENFQNMIAKEVLAGVGWPYSLTIEANSNGTANRLDLQRGELAVSDRQALLKPWARKAVTYAISKAIENGELPSNDEFYKWNFTMPKKLSIDIGRDRSARLKDYEAGITTLETIVAEEGGGDVEEHLFQLSWEKAMRQKIEQEVFASLNVPLSAN
jgi:capsid protein